MKVNKSQRKFIAVLGVFVVHLFVLNYVSLGPSVDSVSSLLSTTVVSSSSCLEEGQFAPKSEVLIDKTAIQTQDKNRLDELKQFTFVNYERHMMNEPGKEHYALLHYLSREYGDCRHVTDIGTRVAASALAMGSAHSTPVWTFDIPTSRERVGAFRGKSEEEWQRQVQAANVTITFYNLDLLRVSDEDFRKYMSTWLIVLDTFHYPDTTPFEREFFQRLVGMGFRGILLLDDIHLNNEMKKWWKELQDSASMLGYKAYDVTFVGHAFGTGLLDFSGKVKIVE